MDKQRRMFAEGVVVYASSVRLYDADRERLQPCHPRILAWASDFRRFIRSRQFLFPMGFSTLNGMPVIVGKDISTTSS